MSTLTRATPVAAFTTTAAWSEVDPATSMYRLAVLRGRRWTTVAVSAALDPVDVDVGPGPRGTAVTYSRCSLEPPERFGPSGLSILPDYTRGHGCRMYRYDVRDGVERPLAGSRHGVLPTVWKGRVAYLTPNSRRLRTPRAVGGGGPRPRGQRPRGSRLTSLDLAPVAVSPRSGADPSARACGSGAGWSRAWRRGAAARYGLRRRRAVLPHDLIGSSAGCPETYWAYLPRFARALQCRTRAADLSSPPRMVATTPTPCSASTASGVMSCAVDAPHASSSSRPSSTEAASSHADQATHVQAALGLVQDRPSGRARAASASSASPSRST